MTEIAILLGVWIVASFALGVFVGRCIKVGSTEPPVKRVENFEERRQQFAIARRRYT